MATVNSAIEVPASEIFDGSSEQNNPPNEPNNNQSQYDDLDPAISDFVASENAKTTLYKFAKDKHVQILLNNIRALKHNHQLLDVTIASSEKQAFEFHGILLAGYSSIFKTILTSGNMQWFNGILAPKGVATESLQNLEDCLYNPGKFLLDMEQTSQRNSTAMMEFATFFGLEDLAINAFIDSQRVLDNWNSMFDERALTFSVLKTGNSEIPCHGPILAACSPIFRNNLLDDLNDPLAMLYFQFEFEDYPSEIVEKLIKFVYTATLEIDSESVTQLLYASCKLRILAAAKACCNFIKNNLNPESCISFLLVASNASAIENDGFCNTLYSNIENFIIEYFTQVMMTADFKEKMDEKFIVTCMSRADLSEVEASSVFEAMLAWQAFDQTGRLSSIGRLLALASALMDRNSLGHMFKLSSSMDKPRLNYLEDMAGHLATSNRQIPPQQQ